MVSVWSLHSPRVIADESTGGNLVLPDGIDLQNDVISVASCCFFTLCYCLIPKVDSWYGTVRYGTVQYGIYLFYKDSTIII